MNHFITGGTGFLGSSIILDLLMHTSDNMYCLVRPRKNKSAHQRFFDKLEELIIAYNYKPSLLAKAKKHCIIVEGALESDFSEILPFVDAQIDQFIHSAASLNYEERFREEIFSTNVGGTKWALKLSRALLANNFNYISTAYVVGNKAGHIKEEFVGEDHCNNVYESSKLAAERVVASSGSNFRIFRPGIIVGHSKTYYTYNFTGLYGFIRKLAQFKGVMGRIQRGYLEENRITMLSEREATINLVPVDMCSAHIVEAILNDSPFRYHHITLPDPLSMDVLTTHVFGMIDLYKPDFASSDEEMNSIDKKFNEKIDFYRPQFFGVKTFDRTCIDEAMEEYNHTEYSITESNIVNYIDWYLEHLGQSKRKIAYAI